MNYGLQRFESVGSLLLLSTTLTSLSLHARNLQPELNRSENPHMDASWLSNKLKDRVLNLRLLSLNGFCACGDQEQSRWRELVRWETLENAVFTCPSFLACAPHRLLRLKTVRLAIGMWSRCVEHTSTIGISRCFSVPDQGSVRDVLCSLPPLRELYVKNAIIDDSVMAQHRSLNRLELVGDLVFSGERESFFASSILVSIQNHCKHLKSVAFRLHHDELLPCLEYIAHHRPPVSHLTLDFGVPRIDPNEEEDRSVSDDLSACMEIFRKTTSFQTSLPPKSNPVKFNLTVSVCVPLSKEERTIVWVIAERNYSLETIMQGDELYAIVVPAILDQDVLHIQQANISHCKKCRICSSTRP